MQYILDTAAFFAVATNPDVLPCRIRDLVRVAESKAICGVTLLELAMHYRRGRLAIEGTLRDFFEATLETQIELLDITAEIAATTNQLPKHFPGDPFDRAIAATARVTNRTLVTPDRAIRDAGFCQVEFYPFRRRG